LAVIVSNSSKKEVAKEELNLMSLRESNWKYDTWGSSSVSYFVFAGTSGELQLKDPAGNLVKFKYMGAGLGISPPKLPKLTGNMAPTDFHSSAYRNTLYISPHFKGTELTRDDICGSCEIYDLGFSLGKFGKSVCAMFLGGVTGTPYYNAVIALECDNVGLSGGASACLGYVTTDGDLVREPYGLWQVNADNGSTYYYRFRHGNIVQWFYERYTAERRYWHFDNGKGRWVINRKSRLDIEWHSGDTESWPIPFLSEVRGKWSTTSGEMHEMRANRL
jgi:hypothetical protein